MAIQAQMYPDNLGLPLGGSLDWLMNMDHPTTNNNSNNINNLFNNSCGLNESSLNLQQKLQQQQFQYQQHQQQQHQQLMVQLQNLQQRNRLPSDNGYMFLTSSSKSYNQLITTTAPSTTNTRSNHMPMNFTQSLATQIDNQRQETDRFISLQSERLKLALQEQRKQQLAVMLKKVEEKAIMLLGQKDEEIAEARKRAMELEEMTGKMEVESQAWQRVAAENEAMAVSLSNKLEELKEQACCLTSNAVDDAESCCEYPAGNRVNEEGETGESRKKMKMVLVCRVCNSGNASILFLPCRHLCSCHACEAFLDSCPVCKYPKRATIEALIS